MPRKPKSEPVNPDELESLALAVVRGDRYPHLATVDGAQPRVRPVSPVRTDGFFVYVASLRSYNKTHEIAHNNKIELCYLSKEHDQVRISGTAEILEDRDLLQEIWEGNPLLRAYIVNLDNPELIVYRIRPTRVRFMREWALTYHEVPLR